MRTDDPVADDADGQYSRRRFLTATAGLTAAAVAGCPGVTVQSFEATPVVLPEDARRELVLGETLLDSRTTTRQVEAVDGEVTLTSYAAAYTREKAFDSETKPEVGLTLLEQFAGRVNDTPGSGSAVTVPGINVGYSEAAMTDLAGSPTVPGERLGFLVPAGAAGENAQPIPSSVMSIAAVGEGSDGSVPEGTTAYVARAVDVFGGARWLHEDAPFSLSPRWLPAADWPTPDNFAPDTPVLVTLGDRTPEETFGVAGEEMPGEAFTGNNPFLKDETPFETGNNPFLTGNNPFLKVAPADVATEDGGARLDHPAVPPSKVPDDGTPVGGPAPLRGGTYGIGVLSTPNAEVAGQSVNPLAGMPFEELLASDLAKELVGEVAFPGLVYEWADGPTVVGDVPDGTQFAGATILGEESETATLGGVAHGGPGPWPWFVLVNAARVATGDSAVVAAGVQRTPVASADSSSVDRLFRATGNNPFLEWARSGASLTEQSGGLFLNGDVDTVFGLDGGGRR